MQATTQGAGLGSRRARLLLAERVTIGGLAVALAFRQALTLATIPALEWDALAGSMRRCGVADGRVGAQSCRRRRCERKPRLAGQVPPGAAGLPSRDNVGSAYCVRDYVADAHLGGPDALAQARAELNARGLRLVLDFGAEPCAIDHPWALQHPEYFIRGSYEDLARAPQDFVEVQGQVYAHGRDPYFPPWRDVIQVNAFNGGLRAAAIATANSIAAQCDGLGATWQC